MARREDVLIFPGFAVGTGPGAVYYAYVPSRNIIVTAGYRTQEEARLVNRIVSSLHLAE